MARAKKSPEMEGFDGVDEELWSSVAQQITDVVVKKKVQESDEIGRIILTEFFGGEIARFREHGGQHKTFQAIAEGCSMSVSYLRYAVLIHDQLKVLSRTLGATDDVGEYLNVSIHRKLLTLTDPDVKSMMAIQIYNEGMDLDQANRAINAARTEKEEESGAEPAEPTGRGRGRPPQSEIAKGLPSLVKTMSRLLYGGGVKIEGLRLSGKVRVVKLSADSLMGCSPEKIVELKNGIETLGKMGEDLKALRTQLAEVIDSQGN